jgi:hypothetical protein
MVREGRSDELALMAHYEVQEKVRVEKITYEITVSLSDDSNDSEEFDFEEDNVEYSPSKPMKGHIDVLKTPTTLVILSL